METDTHDAAPEPVEAAPQRPVPPIPPGDGGPDGLTVFQAFARGDAGGSVMNAVPKKKKAGEDEDKPKEPDHVEDREAQLADAIARLQEAPELTYDEKLKAHDISKEEAMTIVADMFEKGFHEKTYNVVGSHVTVIFRTRLQEDQDRVLARIESDAPHYPTTVNNLVAKHNLSASMMEFMGKDFRKKKVQERYDYISLLPDIVTRVLVKKLTRFDDMMLDVMDEGAISNF